MEKRVRTLRLEEVWSREFACERGVERAIRFREQLNAQLAQTS